MVSDSFYADVHTLLSFFEEDFALAVPKYQREFVWDKRMVTDLLDDIDDTRGAAISEFFIGSIITSTPRHTKENLIGMSEKPKLRGRTEPLETFPLPKQIKKKMTQGNMIKLLTELSLHHGLVGNETQVVLRDKLLDEVPESTLVDGQQRLTTISIMAKILIGWVEEYEIGGRGGSRKDKLEKIILKGTSNRLKLRPGDYQDFILINREHEHGKAEELYKDKPKWQERGIKGTRAIRTAYIEIVRWFDDFDSKWSDNPERQFKLYIDYFLHKVALIFIDVRSKEQENLVFQSLNATGENLTESEKIKSMLFHRASLKNEECAGVVEGEWQTMIAHLDKIAVWGSTDISTDFLMRWARSKGLKVSAGLLRESNLHRAFKNMLKEKRDVDTDEGLRLLSGELASDAALYHRLVHPYPSWDCSEDLIDYRGGSKKQHLPVFLSARRLSKRDPSYIVRLSKVYDVIFGRTLILAETLSNRIETALNQTWISYVNTFERDRALRNIKLSAWDMLVKFSKVDTVGRTTPQIKTQLNEVFKQGLMNKMDPGDAKYFLRKIEDEDGWRNYDKAELQSEHIFPHSQTRDARFRMWSTPPTGVSFGGQTWWWPEEKEDREEISNRLGNYLIIEASINLHANRRSWKANTPNGLLEAITDINHNTATSQELLQESGGKFQYYKHFRYKNESGYWKNGSSVNMVDAFCDKYSDARYWTMGKMNRRTEDLAAIALTKECWSLEDWDIDSMREEERFDTVKDELNAAETLKELNGVEIVGFTEDEGNELNVLKERIEGEFAAIAQSDQERFSVALEERMTPEQKYEISELIELIYDSDFEFTENDEEEIPSEPERPRWNRTVRNAVRNSPDRDHAQNWWGTLRAEEIDRSWHYWIEEDEEE